MSSGVRTPPPPTIEILRISSSQFEFDPFRTGKATDAAGVFGGCSAAEISSAQASQRSLAPQPEVEKTCVKAIAGSRGVDCRDRTGFDLEDGAVPQKGRAIGTNSRLCVVSITALSIAPLAALLFALRAGAARSPALAGAAAGLLAGGLAATLYAMHCFDDSPLFVTLWYIPAVALVASMGAASGSRLLRW